MSLNNKVPDLFCAEIDDDNDSFHSFAQSSIEPSELGSLSDIDDGPEDSNSDSSAEFEFKKNAVKIKPTLRVDCQASESLATSNSSASASVAKPVQYESTPSRTPMCHHMVPKLAGNSQMPDMDLFNMDASPSVRPIKKDALDISPNTEALQRFAFTEIWIEEQQNYPERKRSLTREFTAALDDYFHTKNNEQVECISLEEQQKGKLYKQLFVAPNKSSSGQTASFQTTPEIKPYVSPFEDLPVVAEESILAGQKPHIVVPAGYDLTNLWEYKNPNHWHRRRTTFNDYHP
ncbi:uncharacterized protein [Drosophila virilis]|uniref:Uncharacterized protein n=1 Tax=Drosophila virilis TaxID=7244 RepID=B4LEU7_DROVI|nr:uncharacterized protein LOC6623952 [Drosophila virilis]EDW70204.2 uncharacterized protein Dvir_GJ13678 [Drosophila virilis]